MFNVVLERERREKLDEERPSIDPVFAIFYKSKIAADEESTTYTSTESGYSDFGDASPRSGCIRDSEGRLLSVLKGSNEWLSRVDRKGIRIVNSLSSDDSDVKTKHSISFRDRLFIDGKRSHVADVEEVERIEVKVELPELPEQQSAGRSLGSRVFRNIRKIL